MEHAILFVRKLAHDYESYLIKVQSKYVNTINLKKKREYVKTIWCRCNSMTSAMMLTIKLKSLKASKSGIKKVPIGHITYKQYE